MGGNQSQDTERTVNVEQQEAEDGSPTIHVTTDFLNLLKEKIIGGGRGESSGSHDAQKESADMEEPIMDDDVYSNPVYAENVIAPLRGEFLGKGENEKDESYKWRRKYEIEKEKNTDLKNMTSEEFKKTVEGVREKLSNQIPQLVPVCEDCREKVLDCYRSNPGRPLTCHSEVLDYIQCVKKVQGGEHCTNPDKREVLSL